MSNETKDPVEGQDEAVNETAQATTEEAQAPTEEAKGPQIDYNQYGYRTSETVPIPSVLFYEILGMAALVEKDNTEVYYEDRPTVEETFSEQNTPVNFLNTLGMKAKALRFQLNQVHISNVDNGIATPISVLQEEAKAAQQPAVTLEEGPVEEAAAPAPEKDLQETE